MSKAKLFGALAAVGVAFIASPASAQVESIESANNGDYTVDFFADNLSGSNYGSNSAVIKVRAPALRRTLIRPRTSMVKQLIWSIEDL